MANHPKTIETADGMVLDRRRLLQLASVLGGISFAGPAMAQFNLGKVVDIGSDVVKSETLSDADIAAYCDQMTEEMDSMNPVAGPKDPYGKRLATLASGLKSYDGLNLDIKAYLVTDVNAFAMANGTIRVFAGLMDKFTDDEIRYVIGHEIGHVKHGHTKKRMQAALRLQALQKAGSAVGGTVGQLSKSELGALFTDVITAQHSQGNEKEADDYALAFMRAKNYDAMACVTALDKLAAMDSGGGLPWLQTHPSPQARSKRLKKQLTK